jgi:hypothetical protein
MQPQVARSFIEWVLLRYQLVEQLFQFMKKGKIIEVVCYYNY